MKKSLWLATLIEVYEVKNWKPCLTLDMKGGTCESTKWVWCEYLRASKKLGSSIFATREAAEAKSRQMRERRIASLRKQIAALEVLQ